MEAEPLSIQFSRFLKGHLSAAQWALNFLKMGISAISLFIVKIKHTIESTL